MWWNKPLQAFSKSQPLYTKPKLDRFDYIKMMLNYELPKYTKQQSTKDKVATHSTEKLNNPNLQKKKKKSLQAKRKKTDLPYKVPY